MLSLRFAAKVWNPYRKILNVFFLKKFVKSHVNVMVYNSTVLMKKVESLVGEEIDIGHYASLCTLDIIYGNISKFLNVYKIHIHLYKFIIFLFHSLLKDALFDTQLNSLTNKNCKLAESIER